MVGVVVEELPLVAGLPCRSSHLMSPVREDPPMEPCGSHRRVVLSSHDCPFYCCKARVPWPQTRLARFFFYGS